MKKLLLLLMVSTLLFGCCGNGTKEDGKVIHKWSEEYNTFTYSKSSTTGPFGVSHEYEYSVIDGEDYCVLIESKDDSGKSFFKTYYLPKDIWININENQYVNVDYNYHFEDFTLSETRIN